MEQINYTKYERARILGARALQIAMNAPLLIKFEQKDLEKINFDALKIAEVELNSGVLPISIKKPMPKRKDAALKRTKIPKITDAKKFQSEEELEKEIIEEGEIMEIANPDDEMEDREESSSEQ